MKGVVKFFDGAKGFGFIVPDDGGADIFVHSTDTNRVELRQGDKVQFEVVPGRYGKPRAANVARTDAEAAE